jgi:hypothetical protein
MAGQDENEEVILEALPTGALVFRSQLTDYKFRGQEFAHMSFVSFIVDTWECAYSPTDDARKETASGAIRGRGAPRHPRSRYLDGHPKSTTHQRILRITGHNVLPNVVGPYLPRNDDPDTYQFYCASILALLKPWRNIQELLVPGQTWANAFNTFLSSASASDRDFISGAQYYYQCKDAAANESKDKPSATANVSSERFEGDVNEDFGDENEVGVLCAPLTEDDIRDCMALKQNPAEMLHGAEAVSIARGTSLFQNNVQQSWTVSGACAKVANHSDIQNITRWRESMANDAASCKAGTAEGITPGPTSEGSVTLALTTSMPGRSQGNVEPEPVVQEVIPAVEPGYLKPDQLRAYTIIEKHLTQTLADPTRPPDQLLMQIQDEGGTGKSVVIHCVTKLFRDCQVEKRLVRSAYSAKMADAPLHALARTRLVAPVASPPPYGEPRVQ